MSKQHLTAELIDTNSFYINLGTRYEISRIEFFPTYATEWRGKRVLVRLSCDTYRHSSGMSEWRIYVSRAGTCANVAGVSTYPQDNLTGLAKNRLGDQLRPLAKAWIASSDYRRAYRHALISAITRIANEMHGYGDVPSHELRAVAAKYADEIGPSAYDRFIAAAEAFDSYRANLARNFFTNP